MEKFLIFKKKWEEMSMSEKIPIAVETDRLNDMGYTFYHSNNITESIKYFEKALEVMPINGDALSNLVQTYKKAGLFSKIPLLLRKLYVLNPTSILKEKIIAFTLLSFIIDDYEDDMGMVSLSSIIKETKKNYDIDITDNEIMKVYSKINAQYSDDILTWGYRPYFDEDELDVCSIYSTTSSKEEKCYYSKINVPRSLLKEEQRDILDW